MARWILEARIDWRRISALALSALVLASLALVVRVPASATGVRVVVGPTSIPDGEALAANDVTLMNEYLAVAIAVGTAPPWGVTKMNVLDMAAVVDGVPRLDVLAQFSFVVNGWGNWPAYTELRIVEETPSRAVVEVSGYWKRVRVVTTYTLEAGKKYLHVRTFVVNEGNETYENILSGYAITAKRGWQFTPGEGTRRIEDLKANTKALDDWVSLYAEDYVVGLLVPGYNYLSASIGWVDPFFRHTLKPGETRVFEAWLSIDPVGATCKALELSIEVEGRPSGILRGKVTDIKGAPVRRPVVVVERDGRPYCWAVGDERGEYLAKLPEGTYTVYATAKDHGRSKAETVSIERGKTVTADLADVPTPGKVRFAVFRKGGGEPLDARIRFFGRTRPVVLYLARTTEYTNFERVGVAEFPIAPDIYTFEVCHGCGFISKAVRLENVSVGPGEVKELSVFVEILVEPRKLGWYAADPHHHSDYLDGRTPPEYLVVAQLAAGLDLTFVSDHDWVGNHERIAELSSMRGVPFIPSVEISPGWGHFNIYPIPLGDRRATELYALTASEIFERAQGDGGPSDSRQPPVRGDVRLLHQLGGGQGARRLRPRLGRRRDKRALGLGRQQDRHATLEDVERG